LLLLDWTQLRQQRGDFRRGHWLNLAAVLIVEVAHLQQATLAEKALGYAALISARLLGNNGCDVELLDRLPPSLLREKLAAVEASARARGRRLGLGIRLHVVSRDSAEMRCADGGSPRGRLRLVGSPSPRVPTAPQ